MPTYRGIKQISTARSSSDMGGMVKQKRGRKFILLERYILERKLYGAKIGREDETLRRRYKELKKDDRKS